MQDTSKTYTVVVYEADPDETGYWAEILDLPGCVAQGESIDEITHNAIEAIQAWEETQFEIDGETSPRRFLSLQVSVDDDSWTHKRGGTLVPA
jgi:antitoxin HicB